MIIISPFRIEKNYNYNAVFENLNLILMHPE